MELTRRFALIGPKKTEFGMAGYAQIPKQNTQRFDCIRILVVLYKES
jgi:hypothetical protein